MDTSHPNISIDFHGPIAIARLEDEKILDETQLQSLEGSFLPLIDQNPGLQLVIDFTKVKFLTSSVLGLLIRISKKVYEKEGALRLCAINPKIQEVFKITRLDKIFEIFPSWEDAVVGLKKS